MTANSDPAGADSVVPLPDATPDGRASVGPAAEHHGADSAIPIAYRRALTVFDQVLAAVPPEA